MELFGFSSCPISNARMAKFLRCRSNALPIGGIAPGYNIASNIRLSFISDKVHSAVQEE